MVIINIFDSDNSNITKIKTQHQIMTIITNNLEIQTHDTL